MEIVTTRRTPLHRRRPNGDPPSAIVLHSGEGSREGDIDTLTSRTSGVSSNYYVARDGTVFQFANDDRATQHAGVSRYLGIRGWNGISLGIETEHRAGQSWPQKQLDALAELCTDLVERFGIPREMVVAHRWIAVPRERKSDPSNFPDRTLRPFILGCFPGQGGPLFRVTDPSANVRSRPTRESDVERKLETDDVIEVSAVVQGEAIGGNSEWMKRVNGGGFVHSSLLRKLEL